MKKTVKKSTVKKAQSGERVKGTLIGPAPFRTSQYSVDTTGYAAGKKEFPASIKTTEGDVKKKELPERQGTASRSLVKSFLKRDKPVYSPSRKKNGGKVMAKKTMKKK
jgi:hypothetical protein